MKPSVSFARATSPPKSGRYPRASMPYRVKRFTCEPKIDSGARNGGAISAVPERK